MHRQSVLTHDITDQYSAVEAWMYDKLFAPAVFAMVEAELHSLCSQLAPGARVLDVGCGGGQIPLQLAKMRDDIFITGIDLSPPQIKRAQKRTAEVYERTSFDVGSALDLPYETGSFDTVMSITSIKHWPSQADGLRECVRVLKKNGQLLVVEVDRGCRLGDVRSLFQHSRLPRFLHGIALPFLRTFIIGQGLDLDELRALQQALPVADARVARIAGKPGIVLTGRLESRG